jgi:hypothetical protein
MERADAAMYAAKQTKRRLVIASREGDGRREAQRPSEVA